MRARFLVTVSQYQGVFANVMAQRPGPNLKAGNQTSVSTRKIFMLSSVMKKCCSTVRGLWKRPIPQPYLGAQPLQLSQGAFVLGEILWTSVGRSLESGGRRSAVATQQLPFAIVELRLTALASLARG